MPESTNVIVVLAVIATVIILICVAVVVLWTADRPSFDNVRGDAVKSYSKVSSKSKTIVRSAHELLDNVNERKAATTR